MPAKRDLLVRFNEKFVKDENGCWLWTAAIANNGYGVIGTGPHKVETAHRVSLKLYRQIDPGGNFVCHKCDVRRCVNPDHLYVGTVKDNARDLMERGRPYHEIRKHITPEVERRRVRNLPRGAAHHRSSAKLTEDQARQIYAAAGSQQSIAARFGVCQQTVSHIKQRKTWEYIHAHS